MHTEKHDDPLVELGYERADVSMRGIGRALWFFFGFAVFCAVASIGALWVMKRDVFAVQEQAKPFTDRIPEAPNPLLQTNVTAKSDMRDIRRYERETLNTTAWVDRQNGIVRIPVSRAIDIVAKRGIAKTENSVNAVTKGQVDRPGQPIAGPDSLTPDSLGTPVTRNRPDNTKGEAMPATGGNR
jgi:hypothetical protein